MALAQELGANYSYRQLTMKFDTCVQWWREVSTLEEKQVEGGGAEMEKTNTVGAICFMICVEKL